MTVEEEVASCDFGALDIDGDVSGHGTGVDGPVYDVVCGKRCWTGSGGCSDDEGGGAAGEEAAAPEYNSNDGNNNEQEEEIAIEDDDAVAQGQAGGRSGRDGRRA